MDDILKTKDYSLLWQPDLFLDKNTYLYGFILTVLGILLMSIYGGTSAKHGKKLMNTKAKGLESPLENSRFMTKKEINELYPQKRFSKLGGEKKDGIPLYAVYNKKKKDIDINLVPGMHSLVIGSTGSGKTTTFINPMIQILGQSGAGSSNPQMVRQEIREFLKFMDGFQIDTSCLGDKRRTAYEGIRHDLETIAGQEPTSQLTTDDYINITSMANTIVNTHLYALGAKPEFPRFSGTPDMESDYFNRDWERAQLIKDLAEFERKEEKSKSTMPRAEQGKTEASKRDRIDLKDLSREAEKAGETPSIRQRSRSMSSGQMQRQTRERSKSEPAPVKPELQKDGGPKR